MRRILHLIPYMHADAGGPPVVVRRVSALAKAHGWEASVLTTTLFAEDEAELRAGLGDFAEATVLPRLSRLGELLPPGGIRHAVAAAVEKADIALVHGLWHPLLTGAARTCRRLEKPYLVMPHGMLDPYSLGVRAAWKRAYLLVLERGMLNGAAAIAFTTAAEESAARRMVPGLPDGIELPLAADIGGSADPEPFLAAHPALRGRRLVLFLGRLHHKKGLDRLLAAWVRVARAFPEARLVIAGSGDGDYADALRHQASELGIAGSIAWVGPLAGAMKEGAFAAASAFVLPSRQENFAIAVAEALTAGVPVIVSERVNTAAAIASCGGGIVLPEAGIEDGLATAIQRLLGNPEEAAAMGARGKALAERDWSWERAADSLYRTCEAILDRRNGGRRPPPGGAGASHDLGRAAAH